MKIVQFFLFFFLSLGFAQNAVNIDEKFTRIDPTTEMYYYFDQSNTENATSILEKEFQEFTSKFPGLRKAKFWFRISVENRSNEKIESFFKISTNAISKLTMYEKANNNLVESYVFSESEIKKIDIPLTLQANQNTTFYFEVQFSKSVFFPIQLVEVSENEAINNFQMLKEGLYFGFTFVVLLINLLFFLSTKNRFFIYYCFLLVSITLSIAHVDGIFGLIFQKTHLVYIVSLFNFLLMLSYILFTSNALEMKIYYPKFKFIGISLLGIYSVFTLLYLITNSSLWFTLGKLCYMILVLTYWFSGILLFKRKVYARFLVLGYTILILCNILYSVPLNFGVLNVGFTVEYYKIGSIIEMLVFLYAISYRHKSVEKEKETIKEEFVDSKEHVEKLEKTLQAYENSSQEDFEIKLQAFKQEFELKNREVEVLRGNLKGLKNKEIAEELFLSEVSIKRYNGKLFEKTETKNKVQLVNFFNIYIS